MTERSRAMTFRHDLPCCECGQTPAERGDDVSERAVEFLCSRCARGLGRVGQAKRAARSRSASASRQR